MTPRSTLYILQCFPRSCCSSSPVSPLRWTPGNLAVAHLGTAHCRCHTCLPITSAIALGRQAAGSQLCSRVFSSSETRCHKSRRVLVATSPLSHISKALLFYPCCRNALVCSHDHLTLFLTLVSGLEFIRFDLDLVSVLSASPGSGRASMWSPGCQRSRVYFLGIVESF